jgi:hypothetical protein
MKRIVLTFGLISGAIISAMLLIALPFQDTIGLDWSAMLGYTSMVLAFLLIFFGVRSYRDNVAGGTVRFGRAVAVGGLIALVASTCYVATWEVIYFNFAPDYMTKYQARVLEKARSNGETETAIARKKAEMERFAKLYRNPAINAAVTFLEPLPVALVVALVSAGVLSRRRKGGAGAREGEGEGNLVSRARVSA